MAPPDPSCASFTSTTHMANLLNNNGRDMWAVRLTVDKSTRERSGEMKLCSWLPSSGDINRQLGPKSLSFHYSSFALYSFLYV